MECARCVGPPGSFTGNFSTCFGSVVVQAIETCVSCRTLHVFGFVGICFGIKSTTLGFVFLLLNGSLAFGFGLFSIFVQPIETGGTAATATATATATTTARRAARTPCTAFDVGSGRKRAPHRFAASGLFLFG